MKHPGIVAFQVGFNVIHNIEKPRTVKLLWLACLAGDIADVILMFTTDVPILTR